ncbi:Domain of uncharacterised function (DUF2825) [Escherichia coli]|uniref:Domain of uncharacterized function (DUF2825) n=1 Tax=Escherichia coli TaxID=562 RepID=A0AB38EUX3_ECOLX|nr:Domain of uncharacterised function (DUF2825) [Escherichia coli]
MRWIYQSAVYPRWREELCTKNGRLASILGLSPLARGTRPTHTLRAALIRFIPADAGNSIFSASDKWFLSVYPRWRGELPEPGNMLADLRGLSPLARGTLDEAARVIADGRFIPAGAGNSLKVYICS